MQYDTILFYFVLTDVPILLLFLHTSSKQQKQQQQQRMVQQVSAAKKVKDYYIVMTDCRHDDGEARGVVLCFRGGDGWWGHGVMGSGGEPSHTHTYTQPHTTGRHKTTNITKIIKIITTTNPKK